MAPASTSWTARSDVSDEPRSEQDGGVEEESGAEAVRAALGRARAAARARGAVPGASPAGGGRRRFRRVDGTRSGARPDARDPQLLGDSLGRLVDERGWSEAVSVGGVMGR